MFTVLHYICISLCSKSGIKYSVRVSLWAHVSFVSQVMFTIASHYIDLPSESLGGLVGGV